MDAQGIPEERVDTGRIHHVGQLAHIQASEAHYGVGDSSGPLFTMYVKMAEEEDTKMTKQWQKDADGILIFTGLFSATVAVLVAVSIQDLRPNPQDTTAFYLGNIYQLLADPNVSRASILSTPVQPPPFSPPKYAIWVNSLWFLSLVIGLTCALLATLLQQWARRYLTITQLPRYSPHKRARIRAFFSDGIDQLYLPLAVETLPILIHLSLFLFFSGLLIYMFNINHTIFNIVGWWVGISAGVYACITFMPIFRHDSPYYAPLSSPVWCLYTGVLYTFFQILWLFRNRLGHLFRRQTLISFDIWRRTYRERLLRGIVKTAQDTATNSKLSGQIDGNVLKWTFDALEEDHELQQFFDGIPGFCDSNVVENPRTSLATLGEFTLGDALGRFLDRTLSSNSVIIKETRIMTCVKAVDTGHLPYAAIGVLRGVFERGGDGVLRCVKFGHSLRSQLNHIERGSSLCTLGIVAGIIAGAPERTNSWNMLVKDQLGISEAVLRDYLTHGDSVLLANLIHITRQFLPSYLGGDARMATALLYILPSISGFDIKDTLPVLQHDFCTLWNEIVLQARESYRISISILKGIRHIYLAIHEGTDAAPTKFSAITKDRDPILSSLSSYPSCSITSHRHHPHLEVIVAAAAPPSRRDPSPLPVSSRDDGYVHHAVLPVTPISESSRLSPVDVDSHRRLSASFYPATAAATQGVADPLGPVILSAANSTSDSVPSQRNADLGVVPSPSIPGVSFSSLPISVPTNPLPAGLQSTSGSSASQTGQVTPLTTVSRTRQPTSILRSVNGPTRNSDENSFASELPGSPSSNYPTSSVG